MAQFIESLESRTLLSGSNGDLAALASAGKALVADVKSLGKTGTANFKLIEADLKAADDLKTSAALVKTLTSGGKGGLSLLAKDAGHTVALIKKDVAKGTAISNQLKKKPGNATLEAKLAAVVTTLQTDASNSLATITADQTSLETTNSANVSAIETANSGDTQLSTDVMNTIAPSAQAAETVVSDAATLALVTDVEALIASS